MGSDKKTIEERLAEQLDDKDRKISELEDELLSLPAALIAEAVTVGTAVLT